MLWRHRQCHYGFIKEPEGLNTKSSEEEATTYSIYPKTFICISELPPKNMQAKTRLDESSALEPLSWKKTSMYSNKLLLMTIF